jgi:hypothetical protein
MLCFGFECCSDTVLVSKIEIDYVNILSEKPYRVGCDEFETRFTGNYYKSIFSNLQDISGFLNSLSNYSVDSSIDSSTDNIDTKAKAYVYYLDGHIDKVCINQFGDFWVNDKFIGQSNTLQAFLTHNCKGFAWPSK